MHTCLWVYQLQCTPLSGCMAISITITASLFLFVGVSMTMHTHVWVYGYHCTPVSGCINDNAHLFLGVSMYTCFWVYHYQCTPVSGCINARISTRTCFWVYQCTHINAHLFLGVSINAHQLHCCDRATTAWYYYQTLADKLNDGSH